MKRYLLDTNALLDPFLAMSDGQPVYDGAVTLAAFASTELGKLPSRLLEMAPDSELGRNQMCRAAAHAE